MKHLIHASVITALLGFSGLVQAVGPATTVIASDNTEITIAGQSYAKTFNPTGFSLSDFRNISLNLLVEGDYNYAADESLTFNIDDLYEFVLVRNAVNVVSTPLGSNINFYRLESSLDIEQKVWNAIAADNVLNISWVNTEEVGDMDTITSGQVTGDFVSYSIAGVVPEPSTYALMLAGLGLVGFMANRRRKV